MPRPREVRLSGHPIVDVAMFRRDEAEADFVAAKKSLHEAENHTEEWNMCEDYINRCKIDVENCRIKLMVYSEYYSLMKLTYCPNLD